MPTFKILHDFDLSDETLSTTFREILQNEFKKLTPAEKTDLGVSRYEDLALIGCVINGFSTITPLDSRDPRTVYDPAAAVRREAVLANASRHLNDTLGTLEKTGRPASPIASLDQTLEKRNPMVGAYLYNYIFITRSDNVAASLRTLQGMAADKSKQQRSRP